MKNKIVQFDNRVALKTVFIVSLLFCIAYSFYALSTEINLPEFFIGFGLFVVLLSVIFGFRYLNRYFIPVLFLFLILFVFYSAIQVLNGWNSVYFIFGCLNFSGILFLFSGYRKAAQMIVMNILIGIIFSVIIPTIAPDIPLTFVTIIWIISMLCITVVHFLANSAIAALSETSEDQNSLLNLLTTTANYVVMVDDSNKIVYISSSLAHLAKVDDPELAKGQYFIDIFKDRDVKLLAGKTLQKKEDYTGDWEFFLDGQKRFFRVNSSNIVGSTKGFLINLQDLTTLAERDEIAVMKDSLQIGFFFMDRKYIIQDHYSRFLEEILSTSELAGKCFPDLLAESVTPKELESIYDYFGMVFSRNYDKDLLEDINPLGEFHYANNVTGKNQVFNCTFTAVEKGKDEIHVLVTIYDVTIRTELQNKLREEEAKRHEEMQTVFELIQVDKRTFADFLEDAEFEFGRINSIQNNENLTSQQVLIGIYQSVHAIKSNAVILGLNTFGNKVHNLESKIKGLREREDVPFTDMLNLTMELEQLSMEKDSFKTTIQKIKTITGSTEDASKQEYNSFITPLAKTVEKAASDMGKKAKFVADKIDTEALEKGPARIMKEILMQLIRNSIAHGIEMPEERTAKGKNETGKIILLIKQLEKKIHVKLSDDGKGLDYKKIYEQALKQGLVKKEDINSREVLLKALFMPGFSTSEVEGMHSGRGVGLDLVRSRLREVKGSIKIQSEKDKGTVFNFYIPVNN